MHCVHFLVSIEDTVLLIIGFFYVAQVAILTPLSLPFSCSL